jgi:hypothetical protein
MYLKPTESPLRLHHEEVWSDDSAPHLELRRVTWAPEGVITVLNFRAVLDALASVLSRGRKVPPAPEWLTVQMKVSEYRRALEHKHCDHAARKWADEHLTARVGIQP